MMTQTAQKATFSRPYRVEEHDWREGMLDTIFSVVDASGRHVAFFIPTRAMADHITKLLNGGH